jgi:phosphate butyryltransferase
LIKTFAQLYQAVTERDKQTIAVVAADDPQTLEVVKQADARDLAKFILLGSARKIHALLQDIGSSFSYEIIDEPDPQKAATMAVHLVREGKADTLMKGMIHSKVFLQAVLNKETGLNTGRQITQISVFEKAESEGLLMLTDCAIAVQPTLAEKEVIIKNAVDLAHRLGYLEPNVAILAAVEVVNPSMPETVDAAILSKMAERGQITGCYVDGPLAFDNIISKQAAIAKGINSRVAGNADIVLVPNLVTGNALSKAFNFVANRTSIAATVGATIPVVFNSRTESVEGKLLSIALASYCVGNEYYV